MDHMIRSKKLKPYLEKFIFQKFPKWQFSKILFSAKMILDVNVDMSRTV